MLDLHNSVRVWLMHFAGTLCLTSLAISPLEAAPIVFAQECDPATWLQRHAEEIGNEMDAQELVELIVSLRNYVVSQGCQIPDLTAFLEHCRTSLSNQGFFLNDAIFDTLKREIRALDRGDAFDQIKNHKKKKNKELRVNSKTAVGFLKFVAGGLLCLVPIPVVQGVGVGLAVLGVSEMADGAREQADDHTRNDDNQRMNRELELHQ